MKAPPGGQPGAAAKREEVAVRKEDFIIISRKDRCVLRDVLPLKKPLSIILEPTNLCNFRCTFCYQGSESLRSRLKPIGNMDLALYRKILDEIGAWEGPRLKMLRLQGCGEPFVHPHFLEMVKIAKQSGVAERIDFFTNGSIMNDRICHSLIESGVDIIRFSVYSMYAEKHRRVTQTDFDHRKIHRNIRRLRELRDACGAKTPHILVKMFDTYSEENELFIRTYEGIADEVDLEKVNNLTNQTDIDFIGAYYHESEHVERTLKDYRESLNEHGACSKPFYMLFINSQGGVSPCCDDCKKIAVLGDLNRHSLQDVWRSRALYDFRKAHLTGNKRNLAFCSKCSWFRLFPPEDNVDGLPEEMFIPGGGFPM